MVKTGLGGSQVPVEESQVSLHGSDPWPNYRDRFSWISNSPGDPYRSDVSRRASTPMVSETETDGTTNPRVRLSVFGPFNGSLSFHVGVWLRSPRTDPSRHLRR